MLTWRSKELESGMFENGRNISGIVYATSPRISTASRDLLVLLDQRPWSAIALADALIRVPLIESTMSMSSRSELVSEIRIATD